MEQNKVQATTGITFRILVALSICHCLNDTLQSVISAVYPLFKEDLGLSFAQIGLITLVYQSAASVCQPLTGLLTNGPRHGRCRQGWVLRLWGC